MKLFSWATVESTAIAWFPYSCGCCMDSVVIIQLCSYRLDFYLHDCVNSVQCKAVVLLSIDYHLKSLHFLNGSIVYQGYALFDSCNF